MNHIKFTSVAIMLVIALTFSLMACSSSKQVTLSISPSSITVTVGDNAVNFQATLENSSETINWVLTGAGNISVNTGTQTRYTPPVTGGASTATLKATAGSAEQTVTITIEASTAPSISITPSSATVTVGGSAIAFTATPENSTEPINWTLTGAGSISAATGTTTNYTPPTTGTASTAILKATAGTVEQTATITIEASTAPSISIDPPNATVTVGGSAIPFTATLANSSEPINWTLTGAGSLSATTGTTTNYTPPATGTASTATLKATAGTLEQTATITIEASSTAPSISITPPSATVTVGDSAVTFTATLTNSTEPINWILTGVGNLSTATGTTTNYTPPDTGGANTAILKATAGAVEQTAIITIEASTAPSISTVSLPNSYGTSKQLRQGAGFIKIRVTGKNLGNFKSAKLGLLTSKTVANTTNTTADITFNISHGLEIGKKELSITVDSGTAKKVDALEVTTITAGNTGLINPGNDVTGKGTPELPYRTLTKASSVANNGDTIFLGSTTYDLASGEVFPIAINNDITINGESNNSVILKGVTGQTCLRTIGNNVSISNLIVQECNIGISINQGTTTLNEMSLNNNTRNGVRVLGSAKLNMTNGNINENGTSNSTTNGAEDNVGLLVLTKETVMVEGTMFDKNGAGSGPANTKSDGVRVSGDGTLVLKNANISNSGEDGVGVCCGTVPGDLKPVVNISDTQISSSGDDGLNLLDDAQVTLTNVSSKNNSNNGITIDNAVKLGASDLTVEKNLNIGIYVDGTTSDFNGSKLVVSENTGIGMQVVATPKITINMGEFKSNGNGLNEGLSFDGGGVVELSGLTVNLNATDGISLAASGGLGPTSFKLRGSTFTGNGNHGINIFGTAIATKIDLGTKEDVGLGTVNDPGANDFNNVSSGFFHLNDSRAASTEIINAVGNTLEGVGTQPSGLKTGVDSEGGRWNIDTADNKIQF